MLLADRGRSRFNSADLYLLASRKEDMFVAAFSPESERC
jgi:hypothetical protein